ncbi:MAG: hypothetical protein ACO1RA_15730 [Planctomycetaceae bacterium]
MSQSNGDAAGTKPPDKKVATLTEVLVCIGIFVGTVSVLSLPLFWWANSLHSERGLELAFFGFAICLVSGSLALLVGGLLQQTNAGASGALVAIAIRLAPPMAGGMLNEQLFGKELGPLFFKELLGFYFIALIVETALMVKLLGGLAPVVKKS